MILLIALFLFVVISTIVFPFPFGVRESIEPRRIIGYDKKGNPIKEDTKGSRFDRWA